MASASQVSTALTKMILNMHRMDEIINGGSTTDVEIDSGSIPSMAKLEALLTADVAAFLAPLINTGRTRIGEGQTVTVYCNYATGNDSTGLGTLLAPFKTWAIACLYACRTYDWNDQHVIIQLADNDTQAEQNHFPVHSIVGGQGGEAFIIQGARRSITGVANNGSGAVRLAVSTTNMTTGDVKLIKSSDGGTRRGEFAITVIDGGHVDLVGSTFSGTSIIVGDTIDGESKARLSGSAVFQSYFGRPRELRDIKLESTIQCADIEFGSMWYFDNVTICGGGLTPIIGLNMPDGDLTLSGPLKFAGGASFSCIFLGANSSFDQAGQNIHFTADLALGLATFLNCETRRALFDTSKFVYHGHTVTGAILTTTPGARIINSASADPNDFPGTDNSSVLAVGASVGTGGAFTYGVQTVAAGGLGTTALVGGGGAREVLSLTGSPNGHGDADATLARADFPWAALTASLTMARTWTLPATPWTGFDSGDEITVVDGGGINGANTLTVAGAYTGDVIMSAVKSLATFRLYKGIGWYLMSKNF